MEVHEARMGNDPMKKAVASPKFKGISRKCAINKCCGTLHSQQEIFDKYNCDAQCTISIATKHQATMWPFSDSSPEVEVENNISTHEVTGYTIDALFIIIAVIAVVLWKWRRNMNRLKSLEAATRRNNLNA